MTVNPYLGSDGVAAVHQDRRQGTKGRLRPRPNQQRLRRRISGSARPAENPCTVMSPIASHSGPSHIAAIEATASSAQSSARPTPSSSRSCARHFPECSSLVPGYGSQGATGTRRRRRFRFRRLGRADQQFARNHLRIPAAAYHARFGDDWQAAVGQAVHDMIDDLAANTTAGRIRETASAAPIEQLRRHSR